MRRISVLVEGQTEEKFIKEVLTPYLIKKSTIKAINIQPVIIKTATSAKGVQRVGGYTTYAKMKKQIQTLLDSSDIVSMMFDYYGLPDDFPAISETSNMPIYAKIDYLYKNASKNINNRKFIPYISLHEFETLIFVDPAVSAKSLPIAKAEQSLRDVIRQFDNIEKINDGATTHPSIRIAQIYPEYKKDREGIIITQKIGIDDIRSKCQNFDDWINRLLNAIQN